VGATATSAAIGNALKWIINVCGTKGGTLTLGLLINWQADFQGRLDVRERRYGPGIFHRPCR
jgi:threonine aldolase